MHGSWKLSFLYRFLVFIGVIILIFILVLPFTGKLLDYKFYDSFFLLRGPSIEEKDIVIVGIDDISFQEINMKWPWPRSLHAKLLSHLHERGAKVVAFDVLFDTLSHRPEEDNLLQQAIAKQEKVVLAATLIVQEKANYDIKTWLEPLAKILSESTLIGSIDLPVDSDGEVRRVYPIQNGKWTFGFLAASLFSESAITQIEKTYKNYRLINYLGKPNRFPIIPYYQVLDPEKYRIPPNLFKDKLVFIGSVSEMSNTPSMPDHFLTPYSSIDNAMSGVEIHATIAQNLLKRNFIKEPNFPSYPIGALLAVSIGFLFTLVRPIIGIVLFIFISISSFIGSYFVFSNAGVYIALSSFAIPLTLLFLHSIIIHYYELYRTNRVNRRLLYESEEKIQQILGSQQTHDFSAQVKVFISYRHKAEDAQYMAELVDFLSGLERDGIHFWTDQKLKLGEEWNDAIRDQLNSSNIALVLVSQSYLDSDYCINTEVQSFLDRNIHIMPIILSPCEKDRHAWLRERQYLPSGGKTLSEHYKDPGKRQRIFLEIRNELRNQAKLNSQLSKPGRGN